METDQIVKRAIYLALIILVSAWLATGSLNVIFNSLVAYLLFLAVAIGIEISGVLGE